MIDCIQEITLENKIVDIQEIIHLELATVETTCII